MMETPDAGDNQFRVFFFRHIKTWAEQNLEGNLKDPPVPFLASHIVLPELREMHSRIKSLEENVGVLRHAIDGGAFQCRLAVDGTGAGEHALHLVTGSLPGLATRAAAIKEIRDFTRDAEKVVLVDPYAYGGDAATASNYVDELCKAARIGSPHVRSLHVIFNSRQGNTKAIKDALAERASTADVVLTDHDTDTIHDRVWIVDGKRGLVVGTSFGGIGKRAAFLLPLPDVDFAHIKEFLTESGLLKGKKRAPETHPRGKRPGRVRSGDRKKKR